MDPQQFAEFLVYFPHDREFVVLPKRNLIFRKKLVSVQGQTVVEAIYDDEVYSCIVIQAARDEGALSQEVVSQIRKLKEKLKISTILEKVPRVKTSRLHVPPPSVSVKVVNFVHLFAKCCLGQTTHYFVIDSQHITCTFQNFFTESPTADSGSSPDRWEKGAHAVSDGDCSRKKKRRVSDGRWMYLCVWVELSELYKYTQECF